MISLSQLSGRAPRTITRPPVQGLSPWFRREIPSWCLITEPGRLMTPKHHWLWVHDGCDRCLDLYWDGITCRADFYTWYYGEVYRYQGPTLPTDELQWTKERYKPSLELEIKIINLAGAGVPFREILKRVKRPRAEVCAILNEHDYPGWGYFINGN